MEKIWFIYDSNFVSGPYSTEAIQSKLDTGNIKSECKIWWKGQRDWIEIANWQKNLGNFEESISSQEEAVWYALKDGHTLGPNTKSQLIEILSSLANLSQVRVWKKGQEKWSTVYQYNDISDQLGITKRKYPRAPIIGEVIIEDKKGKNSYVAATISEGGLGVTGQIHLNTGDEVDVVLRSPLLVTSVHAKAVVRHITEKYCGLEYVNLHKETKGLLVDYVNQFKGPSTQFLKNVS